MNNIKLKKILKENKWIIMAVIFFFIWKFFLAGVLWQNRTLPPEPDDSLIYAGFINSVKECPSVICEYPYILMKDYVGFQYLPYRLFFGMIAKIFNADPVKTFHFSFYFGYLLLAPILILFLSSLTKNKNLLALSLFFLALYNGSGAYHGFFWVTPVFFAVIIFLLLFRLVINEKNKYFILKAGLLIPIFIYLHPSAIYAVAVFTFFYIFYAFLTSNWQKDILKKVIIIITISFFSYAPLYVYLNHFSSGNPLGIKKTATVIFDKISVATQKKTVAHDQDDQNKKPADVMTNLSKNTINKNYFGSIFPGYEMTHQSYFLWIFPHWIFMIIFVIITAVLLYKKEFILISIYLSLLIFVVLSSLNTYGYRSVVYLWPITYILYAFGFWHIFQLVNNINSYKLKLLLKFILVISIVSFALINIIYSYAWNEYSNTRDNFYISKKSFENLANVIQKDDYVYYGQKVLHSFSLNTGLIYSKYTGSKEQANYFVYLSPNNSLDAPKKLMIDNLFDRVSIISGINRKKNNQTNVEEDDTNGLHLLEKTGGIEIYKK